MIAKSIVEKLRMLNLRTENAFKKILLSMNELMDKNQAF